MKDSRLFYLNENNKKFAGFNKETSPFIILGIPMDITSSFRPGSRFTPSVIRDTAQYIEFYSVRTGVDMGEIGFNDVGDVILHPSAVEENLSRISSIINYFVENQNIPISIGGEHTITAGVIRGMKREGLCVISFDAHLDLREEYMGYKYDHACVMRRISEYGVKIIEVGTRAVSKEELEYAKYKGIIFFTPQQVKTLGAREVSRKIINSTQECKSLYISIDMDGIDPAYAPGVATPEPEGLDPSTVLDIINLVVDKRVIGFDIVEISPPYDTSGITTVLGAKLIMETAASIYKAKWL
ncbi:agmatinase [Sulfolobus sp. A20]|uniref:agmatinase n=1 Tax=Saccharolobus sp. A20 TaxID=1891280 RepID=UPI0008460175|nr:agmatinase [Sulfolobus sp. A20]TRM82337.1 agmatinase [Sulfolobus sp. D5]TRM87470.1 agmatinase [Sulfolobus sp. E3]TRM89852.1 agmatinase [Sulfolobus sp. C3]TRM95369.1 agmatinase [Sulfolobus sp. A20-N-G8]TRM97731.1 agmatinase [Sulfolobus sp. F1]